MWRRMLVRTIFALLLMLSAVLFFDYLSFPTTELPPPHKAALRAHVARDTWEGSELLAHRLTHGYAVTLTRRYADGRAVRYRYEVSDQFAVSETGVSVTYPPRNAVNLLLALTLGLFLSAYAALTWLKRRR
ncbi:MAG: hypothetical protein DDT37_01391 [Firmicutes bacterium]|nr:hypothetical protein [candidate division NPL-UPA2 bacterium]MBT9154899.1 hypothetical protein [candidate division NPL-UPA2 bacterium]MBT9156406.1 hypothetical protein [candidate division NPL-UPA2 bacterium]